MRDGHMSSVMVVVVVGPLNVVVAVADAESVSGDGSMYDDDEAGMAACGLAFASVRVRG